MVRARRTRAARGHLAIETTLTLRAVFRLTLRQSEGLIRSIMRMLNIDLPVPDHTTLSRRGSGLPVHDRRRFGADELQLIVDGTGLKLHGAGEWLFKKQETAKRHSWRKLHIGIDADSGEIAAFDLTDKEVDDALHVAPLLDRLAGAPVSFMGDGAYDRNLRSRRRPGEKSEVYIHRASTQRSRDWPYGRDIANLARPTCSRGRRAREDDLAKYDWLQQALES
jgi:IS5 family transposase